MTLLPGGSGTQSGSEEDRYRRLLEGTAGHAVFMLDPEGRISMWPDVARNLYGYEADTVIGQPVTVLFSDSRGTPPPIEAVLDEARTGRIETEGWHERTDGSVFWATCMVSPLIENGVDGFAVVVRDTTERKQYERMLERQNDRLKEFTDILSHDLQTPLNVIDGRLSLYQETGEAEHLAAIEATTDRMERLVEDLLRVARQGQVVEEPEPTRLGPLIETAREGALPGSATVEYESVPRVMADPDRLVQMFENLLRNSAEHGGDGVTVRVGPLEDGFYVEDDGPGIPTEDRERVFEHGYTTREDGTGYGLSVVRSIVGAHGWDIEVTESKEGGSRFEVTGTEFVSDS